MKPMIVSILAFFLFGCCTSKESKPIELYHPTPCAEANCDIQDSTLSVQCNCRETR